MMKLFILIMFILSFNSYSKSYEVKKKNLIVKVEINIDKNYEVKSNYLNTPLLIWNKNLKHQGPSIGLFPLEKMDKSLLSTKAVKTNLEKFKSENIKNLKSLKAIDIKFGSPKLESDKVTYTSSYILPGNIKIYSTEIIKKCLSKGLKIKSVVKSVDYKKYKSVIENITNSIQCTK